MSEQTPTPDSRYPRPLWIRLLRSLALRWWIIPIGIIILYILFNFIIFLTHGGNLIIIFLSSIKNFLVSIPLLVLLLVSIPIGIFTKRWAKEDEEREKVYVRYKLYEEKRRQSREREKQAPLGFKLHYILTGFSSAVNSVAWSLDGRYLASSTYSGWGSRESMIKIWDVLTGQELLMLSGHSSVVNSVAWSPNGRYLASGSNALSSDTWGSVASTIRV